MGLTIHRRGDPTALFGVTKERTEEQYNLIQREGLSWWRNFAATTGGEFSDSVAVFWMCDGTDDKAGVKPHVPYYLLRRAIKAVLSDTAATCRERGLSPKRYVDEAVVLLEGLIRSVYNDMVSLEKLLCGGLPKAGPDFRRWEIQDGTRKLTEYLKEQAAAAILLAGSDDNSNSSETKSLPLLLKEIQAFVRVPTHREELREAVNRARKEQPTLINWLRTYIYRAFEAIGMRPDEDKLPAHSLDDAEGLLLDRILIAAVHDFLSEPDVGRIAFDLSSGSDFDVDAYEIVHTLESEASNGALLRRAWDALDTVKQNATNGAPAAGTPLEKRPKAKGNGTERIAVDLNEFSKKKCGSYPFLVDLLNDLKEEHAGISFDEKRHGTRKNQPDQLRAMLIAKGLNRLAAAVKKVKGSRCQYILDINPSDIDVVPPKIN